MKRNLKILFGLSLVLNLILAIGITIIIVKFKLDISAKIASKSSHAVVMFGDSQIYNADWNEDLNRSDVYNAGTPGFTTSHFVWLVQEKVIMQNPRICFIEGGINDIAVGIPLKRTFHNFESIVDTLLSHKIVPVLQSVLYTNHEDDITTNLKVDTLNFYLKSLAKLRNIEFVDVNSSLSTDGKLKKNLTYDGTHLKKEGYLLWAPKILAILKRKQI
ncbi:lysophospholipase L1-like esterase [Pedobacter sp. UYP24]